MITHRSGGKGFAMQGHGQGLGVRDLRLFRAVGFFLVPSLFAGVLACRDDARWTTGPTSEPALAAATVTTLLFSQVSAGLQHTCGITSGARAYCWGSNPQAELGNGTTAGPETCPATDGHPAFACSTRPVAVQWDHGFRQISAGARHTCGVTDDNRLYCWGANGRGELGDGTTTLRASPVVVGRGLRFRQVDAGGQHTCAVTTDNIVYCWGLNVYGELGDGTVSFFRSTPAPVVGGHLFRQVTVGDFHTCGVTTSDAVFCWGSNREGQVGDSSTAGRRPRPRQVAGGHQFRQADAGGSHTCAVTTDSRAFCWGDGRLGQLGNGKTNLSFWPRAVSGRLSFDRVSAGGEHTCGETTANQAYCWGYITSLSKDLTPVAVAGGLSVAQVSAGGGHACGKTDGGVVYCWGGNDTGQLGDGTTTDRPAPTLVVAP